MKLKEHLPVPSPVVVSKVISVSPYKDPSHLDVCMVLPTPFSKGFLAYFQGSRHTVGFSGEHFVDCVLQVKQKAVTWMFCSTCKCLHEDPGATSCSLFLLATEIYILHNRTTDAVLNN